jgi:glycosyltransferase involved in cell wall biosynthesis
VRCALYHPWIYLTSGIERSFVELLRRSRHDWTLYTHRFEPGSTYPELRDAPVVELSPRVSVERSLLPLARAARTIARTDLPLRGEQALLVSSEGLGDFALARAGVPAACFCHTPLKILHDPATVARLREQRPAAWAASRVLGPAFTLADRRMWRRYAAVLANSEETRRRIGRARLADPARVEVLHPGVDPDAWYADPGRPAGHDFLVAGRIMWQKSVETAIEAVRLLADRPGGPPELIIAGAVDVKSRPYLAALRERAAGLPVTFEPDPTDARLRQLYAGARALVFTAPNEDWGMVPLEAMASATPVIAPRRGGPAESVQDGRSGWLVEPGAAALAQRMASVAALGDAELRDHRAAARTRALDFGWDPFVARIDAVMEGLTTPGASPVLDG